MLVDKERKEIVDYIVAAVTERGKFTYDTKLVQRYEFGLSYCSLGVLRANQKGLEPVVEIMESFGNPEFRPEQWPCADFDGIRTLYRGGSDGLHEVAIQGIHAPSADGLTVLPGESLRRSRDSTGEGKLTIQDLVRFDSWLKYAHRELLTQLKAYINI